MSQQIYLSVLSSLLALIFLAGFLVYRYFFPKKKNNYLWLLILVALLPCISIFRPGPYESGDFVYHLYRAMAFSDALKDGIIIPSWAANLNGSYGYPVFIFIYNTPYYILSLLNLIGFSFIFSEKS